MKILLPFFFLLLFSSILYAETKDYKRRKNNLEVAAMVGDFFGLPKHFAESMAWEESRLYETAVGKNNIDLFCSFGLFQINETCEKELANKFLPGGYEVYDRLNPEHSATIGIKYILALHKKYGNWKEALCAYNWGPGNVDKVKKYSDIPLKTRQYAENIINRVREKPWVYLEK